MGDTNITYSDRFDINTFKQEIIKSLGNEFWDSLCKEIALPDIETECQTKCTNMVVFIDYLISHIDEKTLHDILVNVRHGLKPSQSAWAYEEFLKSNDLDSFLAQHRMREQAYFQELHDNHKDFYGQEITDDVLAFVLANKEMLGPVRKGNKLICKAFPANIKAYLAEDDEQMKRYYACHCPFAKESILSQQPVSSTLCNCSLGHVMNFCEAFTNQKLNGRVVSSVLHGDLLCEYEIDLPYEILKSMKISDIH